METKIIYPISLAFLVLTETSLASTAMDPRDCRDLASAQTDLNRRTQQKDQELARLSSSRPRMSTETPAVIEDQRITIERQFETFKEGIDRRIADLTASCERARASLNQERLKCEDPSRRGTHRLDESTGRCVSTREDTPDNPNRGECNNAEIFRGQLRGQACKQTAETVKDVRSQQEALTATTQAASTAYAGMQAMQASGQQADAQDRQRKVLQAMAIAKIATGGLQLAGAAQLRNAAGDADSASDLIRSKQKELATHCDRVTRTSSETMEVCFYNNARKHGIEPDQQNYASFERMRSGASQTKEQADRARALAQSSMVTGMADTLVGLQAMQMARLAGQNATGLGLPPMRPGVPPQPMPGFRFNAGQSAPQGGGIGNTGPVELPSGLDAPSDPTLTGSGPMGTIRGGLRGPKDGFRNNPNARPRVASGVSGGGGGRGGGGGGLPANRASRAGGGARNTTAGNEIGGGGGAPGFRTGGAANENGGSAFADALAKLFPQNSQGAPVVDTRELASQNPAQEAEVWEEAASSDVEAVELSIFEQISARYRALSTHGRI